MRRLRRAQTLLRGEALHTEDRGKTIGDGELDLRNQVNAEGHNIVMLALALTLIRERTAEGPTRLRKTDTRAPTFVTMPEDPSSATFARMATPWGARGNTGVWGAPVKNLASACRLVRILIALDVMEKGGRMLGRGTTRLRDIAARPTIRCCLGVVDAALMSKGDRVASTPLRLELMDAPKDVPQADCSLVPRLLGHQGTRARLRPSGWRLRRGCTSPARASWGMASGLRSAAWTRRCGGSSGTLVHQFVGSSRCLGATSGALPRPGMHLRRGTR